MSARFASCAEHDDPIQDNYVAFMEDAEARWKRGERQKRCAMCGYYRWPLDSPEAPTTSRSSGSCARPSISEGGVRQR